MGHTIDEIKKIKNLYLNEFKTPPYDKYLNGIGISNLRIRAKLTGEDLKLKEGESLDDLCLKVNLKTKLPPPLTLPSDYNDVRVFYDVIGEITAR